MGRTRQTAHAQAAWDEARAKEAWGETAQWAEYKQKSAGRTSQETAAIGEGLLALFVPFGDLARSGADPACADATEQATRIQAYISAHYYTCTDEIFAALGRAYGAGGAFTDTIDDAAGAGAAAFAARAVEAYLARRT